MTVSQLIDELRQYDDDVHVAIRVGKGSNPNTTAEIARVVPGRDWEHGKVVIVPEIREGEQ